MKTILTAFLFFTISTATFAQEAKFKEYSYSEFFDLIENEKDSVFNLKDAIIRYNPKTDSLFLYTMSYDSTMNMVNTTNRKDTLHIDNEINLNNVHFLRENNLINRNLISLKSYKYAGLGLIHFHKKVTFYNTLVVEIFHCTFDDRVRFTQDKELVKRDDLKPTSSFNLGTEFNSSIFKRGIIYNSIGSEEKKLNASVSFGNCEIYPGKWNNNVHSAFNIVYSSLFNIAGCKFYGEGLVSIYLQNIEVSYFAKNTFPEPTVDLRVFPEGDNMIIITGNTFQNTMISDIGINSDKIIFEWGQLQNGIINYVDYQLSGSLMKPDSIPINPDDYATQKDMNYYLHNFCVRNTSSFRTESKLLGQFHRKYKDEQDIESANQVYVELKNLQTSRFAYQYSQNPTFKTFFTWKINQFLKIFSAYGTEPARAIIFSFYVILIFALIYLFFPNSWDSHGKHRIIHRYTFFMKYLNRNQGIHEVYLEDKQPELLAFHEFKYFIDSNAKTVPRFFTATALPLYRWALSGTKLTASLLSRFDVLKGTWQEVPPSHRWWKVLLLVGAFLIAIAYDILIKILNALMLSINTFTTLGFGEIPIKGLPRYLAIIQGFIGWFMLTIFSVSLISQLLN